MDLGDRAALFAGGGSVRGRAEDLWQSVCGGSSLSRLLILLCQTHTGPLTCSVYFPGTFRCPSVWASRLPQPAQSVLMQIRSGGGFCWPLLSKAWGALGRREDASEFLCKASWVLGFKPRVSAPSRDPGAEPAPAGL